MRDELIDRNPCVISGAGSAKRRRRVEPLTPVDLHALAEAMPPKHKAAALISGWCALRYGEVTELRRKDINVKAGAIRVERAVTRVGRQHVVGKPKSKAGVRIVAMPPHIVDDVKTHLRLYTEWGRNGLLFPAKNGGHIDSSSMFGQPAREVTSKRAGKTYEKPAWDFYRAREAIGRPDLRWHHLRRTGATLAALSGASSRELQSRLGHSTAQAVMVYQHVADGRDAEIAAKLSGHVGGDTMSTIHIDIVCCGGAIRSIGEMRLSTAAFAGKDTYMVGSFNEGDLLHDQPWGRRTSR